MGRQDRHRGISTVLEHLPSGCAGRWFEERRIAQVDLTYRGLDQLTDVHEALEAHDPCVVIMRMDMGFKTHYVGAVNDGVYCSSAISGFVHDLMVASLRCES